MPSSRPRALVQAARAGTRGTCPGPSSPEFGAGSRRFAARFKNTTSAALTKPVTVLLLGDSNSRWLVGDLCSSHLCKHDDWGKGRFLYQQPCRSCASGTAPQFRSTIYATAVCTTRANDRLGFLMVYGVQPRGPYLYNVSNNENDTRVDSNVRLCAGMSEFTSRVRLPDAVILASLAWDLSMEWFLRFGASSNRSEWKVRGMFTPSAAALAAYETNLRERLREIDACRSPGTRMYLQTTRSFG